MTDETLRDAELVAQYVKVKSAVQEAASMGMSIYVSGTEFVDAYVDRDGPKVVDEDGVS